MTSPSQQFAEWIEGEGLGTLSDSPSDGVPRIYITRKADDDERDEGFWLIRAEGGTPTGPTRSDLTFDVERHAGSEKAKDDAMSLIQVIRETRCFDFFQPTYEIIDVRTEGIYSDISFDVEKFVICLVRVTISVHEVNEFHRL